MPCTDDPVVNPDDFFRPFMTPQQRMEHDLRVQKQKETQRQIDAIFSFTKAEMDLDKFRREGAGIHKWHIKVRADGGVSAVCPECNKRKRCIEQMTTWDLWCKNCGFTGPVTEKPAVPCTCEECLK